MRVGFVSQWYEPEFGVGGIQRSITLALRDLGHDVEVLTGFPNYPTGRLYPGYRIRPYLKETLSGVQVHRAPLYPSHDGRPIPRVVNYLSYAAAASVVGTRVLRDVDVALVYSSPITAALPAMSLERVRHIPYVLLVQDMWPESVTASDAISPRSSRWAERLLNPLCDATYRRAAGIAVTSPGMAERIAARGVPASKISYVPNWVDESIYRPVEASSDAGVRTTQDRPFTVVYAGNLGEAQGLDVLLDAAAILRDDERIGFLLVGDGVAAHQLVARTRELGLSNVTFLGALPAQEIPATLARTQAMYIGLLDRPIFSSTLPSKLQTALAMGRPILGSLAGDAAAVVEASGAGVVAPPGAPRELAAAIRTMSKEGEDALASRGRAARAYYEAHFQRSLGVARLEALLASAVA